MSPPTAPVAPAVTAEAQVFVVSNPVGIDDKPDAMMVEDEVELIVIPVQAPAEPFTTHFRIPVSVPVPCHCAQQSGLAVPV